jgi:acyl dehydratase
MVAGPDQLHGLIPGSSLPPLTKPRLTTRHIARWLAAQQNWDRIHYDQAYCTDFAQLPGPVINGALKQHLIVQFLSQAFDGMGWVWRLQYRFVGADLVGQMLQVQGGIVSIQPTPDYVFVSLACEILNLDQQKVTTRGGAVVVLARDGSRLLDALSIRNGPANFALQTEPADDGSAPVKIRQRIGEVVETRRSAYPLDLSRLRLFADAVMGLSPIFFDPIAAARGPYGEVVAPSLFPLHGIEALPDTLPFSEARSLVAVRPGSGRRDECRQPS